MLVARSVAVRRRADTRLEKALGKVDERLAAIDERITAAVRSRVGDDGGLGPTINSTLQLGDVLQRTLAATHAIKKVDGGRVRVPNADGTVTAELSGLVVESARQDGIEGPPDGTPFVSGLAAWEGPGTDALRSGLVVPLGEGSLAVYSRAPNAFDEEAVELLTAISRRAEPAVTNALEYLKVLEEASTDARTGFGSARALEQALPVAVNAARRFERPLCLIQIDLDDFGQINKEHSNEHGNAVLSEIGRRVLATKRGTDSIFRNSGGADEFFLILPETARNEAIMSYRRLCFEVSGTAFEEVGKVTMSSGLVELRSDDTLKTLLTRVGDLQRLAKDNGKNRLCSDDGEEWVSPH